MRDFIRNMSESKTVLSIVGIVFGIVLVVGQSAAISFLLKILGVVSLIGVVALVVMYFKSIDKNKSHVASAVVLLIIGLLFLITPELFIDVFPMVMGLLLVISGAMNLVQSIMLSRVHYTNWVLALILSVLMIVFGFIIMLHPSVVANVIFIVIGVGILVSSICDLAVSLMGKNYS